MEYILFWVIEGLIIANIAEWKGRDFWKWFIYGVLIFPVALIHILVVDKLIKCPKCGYVFSKKLSVCPGCGTKFILLEEGYGR